MEYDPRRFKWFAMRIRNKTIPAVLLAVLLGASALAFMTADELIDNVKYYLAHDDERELIAHNGFRWVRKDYRIAEVFRKAGNLIKEGVENGTRCYV